VATAFTRLAGTASFFRALLAALFALDTPFLAALFFDAPFLEALFLDVLFVALLFLVVAPFLRAVVVRLRVLAERFLGDALLFDAERALPARLRPVLRPFAPLRPVDFRPADFALEPPRDDFLVVAIHAPRVSR